MKPRQRSFYPFTEKVLSAQLPHRSTPKNLTATCTECCDQDLLGSLNEAHDVPRSTSLRVQGFPWILVHSRSANRKFRHNYHASYAALFLHLNRVKITHATCCPPTPLNGDKPDIGHRAALLNILSCSKGQRPTCLLP